MEKKNERFTLAEVRYYEKGKGFEVPEVTPYVVLSHTDFDYLKYFMRESCLILKRAPYENMLGNISFGSKIIRDKASIADSGIYYIEYQDQNFLGKYNKDKTTKEELEDYVLDSNLFFLERRGIAKERLKRGREILKMYSILKKDKENMEYCENFFRERVSLQEFDQKLGKEFGKRFVKK